MRSKVNERWGYAYTTQNTILLSSIYPFNSFFNSIAGPMAFACPQHITSVCYHCRRPFFEYTHTEHGFAEESASYPFRFDSHTPSNNLLEKDF